MIPRRAAICCSAALLLAACAAPPLTLYTLETTPSPMAALPLGKKPLVIAVARITIPDELDTENIVIRDGNTLRRSTQGRWGTRLSLGITGRLTQRLAERRPDALVTDRPLTETPAYRVLINISRLDITPAGEATCDADWLIVPQDSAKPARRDRAHLTATGRAATDQEVVTLISTVLDQLATRIDIAWPRG